MPNHVDNDLRIQGSGKRIQEFLDFAKNNDVMLDADKFIPYPEKYKEQDAKAIIAARDHKAGLVAFEDYIKVKDGFNSGGYDWCVANWGTKWGIYDCSVVKTTATSTLLNFSTAWSPCLPVIRKMSEMYPDLTFTLRYYECGCGFKGVYKVRGGEVIEDMSGQYRGNRGG